MESSRRQQAKADLGLDNQKEVSKIEAAKAKEEERRLRKELKRQEMMELPSYRLMEGTAKYMDKYFLDPIIGLIPGGFGDVITGMLVLPFIYFSLFVVKSIPLTLAVINNALKDILLGMIPFFIGDIIDAFNRSYLKNMKLIVGYINDDKEIIHEVNRKALWSAAFLLLLCYLIYLMFSLIAWVINWITGLFA